MIKNCVICKRIKSFSLNFGSRAPSYPSRNSFSRVSTRPSSPWKTRRVTRERSMHSSFQTPFWKRMPTSITGTSDGSTWNFSSARGTSRTRSAPSRRRKYPRRIDSSKNRSGSSPTRRHERGNKDFKTRWWQPGGIGIPLLQHPSRVDEGPANHHSHRENFPPFTTRRANLVEQARRHWHRAKVQVPLQVREREGNVRVAKELNLLVNETWMENPWTTLRGWKTRYLPGAPTTAAFPPAIASALTSFSTWQEKLSRPRSYPIAPCLPSPCSLPSSWSWRKGYGSLKRG